MLPARMMKPLRHRHLLALLGLVTTAAVWVNAASPEPRPGAAGERKPKSAEAAERQKSANANPPRPAPRPLAPGEWAVVVEPEGQIFPSLLLASATLKEEPAEATDPKKQAPPTSPPPAATGDEPLLSGDGNGLLSIRLRPPADARAGARVRVELKENALMEATVFESELGDPAREHTFQPAVVYKFGALLGVRQPYPLGVQVRVLLEGRELGQRGVTAWVHSLNDCLYAYQNPDDADDFQDLAWMFAAFVNEDHPTVRTLLREAQAGGVTDVFDGYQGDKPGQVLLQVYAVWNALHRRGLHYADIGTVSTVRDSIWSMHVRFLDESLDDRQANCVDASVLLASVLRKIGLRPFLVLEPGHMFVGFDLDAEGKNRACLETTLLGCRDADLGRFRVQRDLDHAARREVRRLPSWKSFHAALHAATGDFKKHRKKFERDDDPEYQVIDIEAARRQGILPIAHEAAPAVAAQPPDPGAGGTGVP